MSGFAGINVKPRDVCFGDKAAIANLDRAQCSLVQYRLTKAVSSNTRASLFRRLVSVGAKKNSSVVN
jgi:hypothetical protein